MEKSDWLLLALRESPQHMLSPVQIQKTLFLISRYYAHEVGDGFYQFRPYNYGPFDAQIYRDVDRLRSEGLVSSVPGPSDNWNEIEITQRGLRRTAETHVSSLALAYLKRVTNWVRKVPFSELLRTIYTHFPEFRENSVFQG